MGTILNPNTICIPILSNTCARISSVFAYSEKNEYYSCSYSVKILIPNIICMRIWSKFWFRILFVFVFGQKNSIRSPLIGTYLGRGVEGSTIHSHKHKISEILKKCILRPSSQVLRVLSSVICNAMQCNVRSWVSQLPTIASKQLPTVSQLHLITKSSLFYSWSLYYTLSPLCLYLCQWKNAKGICLSLYKYVVGSISVRNTFIQCIRDMKCKLLLDTIPSLFEIQFQNFNLE